MDSPNYYYNDLKIKENYTKYITLEREREQDRQMYYQLFYDIKKLIFTLDNKIDAFLLNNKKEKSLLLDKETQTPIEIEEINADEPTSLSIILNNQDFVA